MSTIDFDALAALKRERDTLKYAAQALADERDQLRLRIDRIGRQIALVLLELRTDPVIGERATEVVRRVLRDEIEK